MNDRHQRPMFDLDRLLYPANAFNHPSEVLKDPDLTENEKRGILASWASDACAIEAAPDLRTAKTGTVRFDEIMDALKQLDGNAADRPQYGKLINRAERWKALFHNGRRTRQAIRVVSDEAQELIKASIAADALTKDRGDGGGRIPQ